MAINIVWLNCAIKSMDQAGQYLYQHAYLLITKTRLYNIDPLKPHFYIAKLGFTEVYIIFLISAKNIDCVYSLEPPLSEAVLTSTTIYI